jgi:hypothetical protein
MCRCTLKRGEMQSIGNMQECNTNYSNTTLPTMFLPYKPSHNMILPLFITLTAIPTLAQNTSLTNSIDSSAITYLDTVPRQNTDPRARNEAVWYRANAPDELLMGQTDVYYEEMVEPVFNEDMVRHWVEDFAKKRGYVKEREWVKIEALENWGIGGFNERKGR